MMRLRKMHPSFSKSYLLLNHSEMQRCAYFFIWNCKEISSKSPGCVLTSLVQRLGAGESGSRATVNMKKYSSRHCVDWNDSNL